MLYLPKKKKKYRYSNSMLLAVDKNKNSFFFILCEKQLFFMYYVVGIQIHRLFSRCYFSKNIIKYNKLWSLR